MSRLVTIADQQRIKPISDNNYERFDQLQQEVEMNDIVGYLGFEFYQELKRNTSQYTKLLEGGAYNSNGVAYEFAGLKAMICYLIYARYVRESYVQDTYNGMVRHNGDQFGTLSAGELANLENRYKQVAGSIWDECLVYLKTLDLPYFPTKKQHFNRKIQAL